MLASAMTASWSVPFLVLTAAAQALGYPGAASVAWAAAIWILIASCVTAVGSLVLSAVGQRTEGDAAVPPAAPELGARRPEPSAPH